VAGNSVKSPLACGGLLLAIVFLGAKCAAQSEAPAPGPPSPGQALEAAGSAPPDGAQSAQPPAVVDGAPALGRGNSQNDSDRFTETRLGFSLLKNIALEQKAVWTSPAQLRLADADWLVPFAGIAAISFASDTNLSEGLAHHTTLAAKSATFSNYGVAAFGGMAGGLFLLGKMTGDDRKEETGILTGEAAIDSLAASTALEYVFGRQQPNSGSRAGEFWRGGTSFPSNHAAAAWAAAGILAHEYPGTFTKILVYGLASAVSLSRATGEKHFPSDVLAGSAIGWFVGQHVYRAHHDPDQPGGPWETFHESFRDSGGRNFQNAGSPYVPLDSWIYPALDELIALGYIRSAFQDVRPLARTECARLVEEAGENISAAQTVRGSAGEVYAELRKEFQNESSILDGEGKERSIRVESLYAGVTAIAGQPLNDSSHFGQTIVDNFGRPYQEGFNTYDGFSGYGVTGRYTIYVRGEFQHAPSAPAYPLAAREAIANADQTPLQPAIRVPAANQFRLLDTYASATIAGWDFSAGKQGLWWGRGVGGALVLSDNAEPMYMFRMRPMEAVDLPSILHWLGPMKGDFFFGKLSGNSYPPRPLIHGLKLTAKTTHYLEASLLATTEFGGVGRPLTLDAILHSFFSTKSSDSYPVNASPGKRTIGADFSYAFPHLRDVLQFYANGLLPEDNPTNLDMSKSPIYIWQRLAIRTGIYLPRLPRLPQLDFRAEAAYTDPPTARSQFGQYVYYNNFYRDLDTNKGNLIGDWVGREGAGYEGWTTYKFTSRNTIQFAYRHARVASDFIPGGETMNDGSVQANWRLGPEWTLSASVQYERWLAPVLAPAARNDVTSAVGIQFTPHGWGW